MDRAKNRYCTRCLQTRRFYEMEDAYVCERCRKTLHKAR
jgi:NADH pyrophosphatase NudC (nudix superfamily)